MSQVISTPHAPQAIGPYVQARKVGDMLFTSGQIALDPTTGALVGEGDVAAQTRQVLANLLAVLEAGGGTRESVVKTTVFIKNMDDFATMNQVYAGFFGAHAPARSCVEAARLPRDVLVEIECIAHVPG